MSKVLLIGIDGATWDLLLPWIEDGGLPTFRFLLTEGSWAVLESVSPPWTIPAWNCLATAMPPQKIGVYSFLHRVGNSFWPYFMVKRPKVPTLWEILGNHDFKNIVLNVPSVHSPSKINGCLVAGWLYGDRSNLAFPPSLIDELNGVTDGYIVDIAEDYPITDQAFIEAVHRMTVKRTRAVKHLLKTKSWDFAFVVFVGSDRIQHRFWFRPEIVMDYFQTLDRQLAEIIEIARNSTHQRVTIFLVSDHGFGPGQRVFNVNEFLRRQGYLKLKQSLIDQIQTKLGRIVDTPTLLRLARPLLTLMPKDKHDVIRKWTSIPPVDKVVDFEKSTAFSYGNAGLVYVNAENPEERSSIAKEIIKSLKSLGVTAHAGATMYKSQDPQAPDILIEINEHVQTVSTALGGSLFSRGNRGDHRSDGIFLACGPEVKSASLGRISIMDVAPTILQLFGLSVPPRADGHAINLR